MKAARELTPEIDAFLSETYVFDRNHHSIIIQEVVMCSSYKRTAYNNRFRFG